MDVDGLNAAVVNPDLRLERTEQQGETPGSEQPRSRSPLLRLSASAPRILIIDFSLFFFFLFLPLAERGRKSDTSQSQSRSRRRRAAGAVARGGGETCKTHDLPLKTRRWRAQNRCGERIKQRPPLCEADAGCLLRPAEAR